MPLFNCSKSCGSGSKTSVKLNSGYEMPLVGLGTLAAQPGEAQKAVEDAIDAGYRHIDTAYLYFNEAEIGKGIKNKIAEGKIKREDIFVTTKLPTTYMTPDRMPLALEKSLDALGIGYIDLYLIHSPVGFQPGQDEKIIYPKDEQGNCLVHEVDHAGLWKAMEKAVEAGKVKSIGVSNFNSRQIQFILDNCKIKPANLQIECHLYLQQKKLVDFCHKNGISVSAYGPLGNPSYVAAYNARSGKNLPNILSEPALDVIKAKYKKSAAQILLRWLTQRDIIVIPKSVNPARMAENLNIFDFKLTGCEMKELDHLDKGLRLYDLPLTENVLKMQDFPWGPTDEF